MAGRRTGFHPTAEELDRLVSTHGVTGTARVCGVSAATVRRRMRGLGVGFHGIEHKDDADDDGRPRLMPEVPTDVVCAAKSLERTGW